MATKSLGIGRLLIAAYAVLALASTGRAGYELVAKFVYIVATIALAKPSDGWRKVAYVAVLFELTGVVLIGFASLVWPEVFAYGGKQVRTVWSYFGIAYGFVPLVLPVLGLLWLGKSKQK
jgi:hypothetical protein